MHRDSTNLDSFLLDFDLDGDLRGDGVERESFLSSTGDCDLDNCFFCTFGDGETEELLWHLVVVLAGGEESSSLTEPSEPADPSGSFSCDPDLDLDISRSIDELGHCF